MLKFITHRPLWVNILVGIVLALAVFLLFIKSLNWLTNHNESKTVPAVTGKSFQEATIMLKKQGFDVEILDSIYSDTSKPMAVLKQFPDADEVVKVNRTVFLTINRSVPPEIEMPNLVGYSFRNAEMNLLNNGLRLGDTTFKPDFARNAVLEQLYNGEQIKPGTKIRMGSRISFVLGDGIGKQEMAVPSLVGLTYSEAMDLLGSMGLVKGAVVTSGAVDDTLRAYIWKQNPQRFTEDRRPVRIRSGQTIDIWIQSDKPVVDSVTANLPLLQ